MRLVLAYLSRRRLEAGRPPQGLASSLSSLVLRLKGAQQPHKAVVAPFPPSVPFHPFGKWFQ